MENNFHINKGGRLLFHRYPDKITEDFHHAHCYLPEQIVYMLQKDPTLVAPAVQAFYHRDQLDVKVADLYIFIYFL